MLAYVLIEDIGHNAKRIARSEYIMKCDSLESLRVRLLQDYFASKVSCIKMLREATIKDVEDLYVEDCNCLERETDLRKATAEECTDHNKWLKELMYADRDIKDQAQRR